VSKVTPVWQDVISGEIDRYDLMGYWKIKAVATRSYQLSAEQ
jgi:hypothetical protein